MKRKDQNILPFNQEASTEGPDPAFPTAWLFERGEWSRVNDPVGRALSQKNARRGSEQARDAYYEAGYDPSFVRLSRRGSRWCTVELHNRCRVPRQEGGPLPSASHPYFVWAVIAHNLEHIYVADLPSLIQLFAMLGSALNFNEMLPTPPVRED